MARRRHRRKGSRTAQPNTVHPDAAGLDIGSTEVYAAVRPERDPDPIRNFPTFTADLHALANWLGILSSVVDEVRGKSRAPSSPDPVA